MTMRRLVLLMSLVMVFLWGLGAALPRASEPVALTGIVSSDAEGPMEGVLVSAKRGTITITVVSDKTGRYSFPASRLGPGEYRLSIRAIGYEPAKPDMMMSLGSSKAECDIKLKPTGDLASQLSSAEWLMSVPGTPEQKDLLYGCISCHTATPILKSTYDAKGWLDTLVRMRTWEPASSISHPMMLPYRPGPRPADADFGKYLASINLSSKPRWDFELKTLPRPTGKATRVIITEYDLPRPDAEPHDAVIDPQGMVWYDDFAMGALGRLDPRTGQTKEWTLPEVKPGFSQGSLDLEWGPDGNLWVARLFQAGVARFDMKTRKMSTWSQPPEYNNNHTRVAFLAFGPKGTVWMVDNTNRGMNLLDPATGQVDIHPGFPGWTLPPVDKDPATGSKGNQPHGHYIYGIASNSKGVGYIADMAGGNIGEIDPATGAVTLYPTPTVDSGPRRMHVDGEDNVWFAENYGLKIGVLDARTKQFKEWDDPTPWDGPYDAVRDKSDHVWTGGMTTDLVTRLNPETGEIVQYLLPTLGANIRRVEVDNSTNPPTFWVGENHAAKIAKVEPLDW
jgi:streptogramin lyase